MTVLVATCFIQVFGGYANINQTVGFGVGKTSDDVYIITIDGSKVLTGDSSLEALVARIKKTCEVTVGGEIRK